MFGNYKEDRFIVIYKNGENHHHTIEQVIKDTQTGALYFEKIRKNGVTMIPLLGPDGKPMIEPVESE